MMTTLIRIWQKLRELHKENKANKVAWKAAIKAERDWQWEQGYFAPAPIFVCVPRN